MMISSRSVINTFFYISLFIIVLAIVFSVYQVIYQQQIETFRHPNYLGTGLVSTVPQYPLRLKVYAPSRFWTESLDDPGLPIFIRQDESCTLDGTKREYALYLNSGAATAYS